MGVYKVNVIEAIKSFLFTSFRLPPYGTGVTFTIHTSHILLRLPVMALREQSCADDNLARWLSGKTVEAASFLHLNITFSTGNVDLDRRVWVKMYTVSDNLYMSYSFLSCGVYAAFKFN